MLIAPIKIYNNSNANFKGSLPSEQLTKKAINMAKQLGSTESAVAASMAMPLALAFNNIKEFKNLEEIPDEIKKSGITYCTFEDGKVIIATNKNDAFYKVPIQRIPIPLDITLKDILLKELNDEKTSFIKGFKNYKDCVDDLGRQDIIRKGLGIKTYQLDNNVSDANKRIASNLITRHSKIALSPEDLFFIEGNAYYYDKINKTAYIVSDIENSPEKKKDVYECKFITDNKGNTIGYSKDYYSAYYQTKTQYKYAEQTEPSENIPEVVNVDNNKLFAEACRFGNYHISIKTKKGIPAVLSQLKNFGFKNVTDSDLQIVRGISNKSKQNKDFCLINYYNPLSGKSLTFNAEGKYLFQTEYEKDNNGQILFCCH